MAGSLRQKPDTRIPVLAWPGLNVMFLASWLTAGANYQARIMGAFKAGCLRVEKGK